MFDSARRLFQHLLVYGSADTAAQFINLFLLPVYTVVLSLTEYGVLALILVLEAFLKIVFRWGFDTSYLRLHYDCTTEEQKRTLAGTAAICLGLGNLGVVAVVWLAAPAVAASLLDSADHVWLVRLLAINLFISSFHFLPLTFLRIEERSRAFAGWTVIRTFGTIAAKLVFVVWLDMSVLGFLVADFVLALVLLTGLLPILRRMAAPRFSPTAARELFAIGLPRVPHGALHQVMAMADRVFLGYYLPLDRLGLYQVASSIANGLKLYPVALSTAWSPFAFESMRRPDAKALYARLATYAFALMAGLAVALVLLADPLVRLMAAPEFRGASALIPLLALGITIQASATFVSTALHIAKRIGPFPIITLVAAAASVAANVLLIPVFGLQGAALAAVCGQTALFAATWYFVRRIYPIPYEASRLARIAAIALTVAAAGVAARAMLTFGPATGVNLLLLAAFPAALLASRVFRPTEIARLRQWMAW
jgi:O-antigen/teichoic acid export membrane protein